MNHVDARDVGLGHVGLVVGLRLEHRAPIDTARVPDVLGGREAAWLGERVPDGGDGMRRFVCDLELHAGGGGRTLFRKAATVSLGAPTPSVGGWTVPMEWQAATFSPLFPVLSGHLRITSDGIELDGRYAPPGGRLGHALDAALLGKAAQATGRWFLGRVAQELAGSPAG